MVGVKNFLSVLQIQIVLRILSPRKIQHKLDVIELNAVFRRTWIVLLKFLQLLIEDVRHSLGPFLGLGLFGYIPEFLVIIHTQFLLNRTELIVKEILSLLLVDVTLDFLINLLLDRIELNLSVKHGKQLHSPLFKVRVLKQCDLVFVILHFNGSGYEVDQELKTVNSHKSPYSLFGCKSG